MITPRDRVDEPQLDPGGRAQEEGCPLGARLERLASDGVALAVLGLEERVGHLALLLPEHVQGEDATLPDQAVDAGVRLHRDDHERALEPLLRQGMWLTLQLTVIAIAGGIALGTFLALMRLSRVTLADFPGVQRVVVKLLVGMGLSRFARWLSRFSPISFLAGFYVNMFRSVPLILVIFWFYFMTPLACQYVTGERCEALGGFPTVLIAFTLFEAAYYCEIKDFLTAADLVAVRDNRLLEMYGTTALVYFVLCLAGSMWVKRLQRRYAL